MLFGIGLMIGIMLGAIVGICLGVDIHKHQVKLAEKLASTVQPKSARDQRPSLILKLDATDEDRDKVIH